VDIEVKGRGKGAKRKRGRAASSSDDGWLSPILSSSMILGLIIGILGYNYISFSLPPGQSIQSIEDVPTAAEIVRQSFFVNPVEGFLESPFIFMLIMLTWILGVLLILSELLKEGKIKISPSSSKLPSGRRRKSGIVFTVMLAIAISSRFILAGESTIGLNRLMGEGLLLIWAALCLFAAFRLIQRHERARLTGGIISMIGVLMALPVVIAGSIIHGLVMAIGGFFVLYFLWDRAWNQLLLPAGILGISSFGVGFMYVFFQAIFIRAGILPPPTATELTPGPERRVLEAAQSIDLLSAFYIFLFLVLLFLAYFLALPRVRAAKNTGSLGGFISLVVLIPLVLFAVSETNLKVIQADIIFKRADPWDKEAGRSGNPETWDNAIAIYEYAIDSAPNEDFYYLWLGRAYLERSGVTEDENEQIDLLRTAEKRLEQAQSLNPYNTDHTANLARLNTRWAELSKDDTRLSKVDKASNYYESAMVLSPQNAVIINEYARLLYLLNEDCDRSIDIYDHSLATDPYYTSTYFDAADIAKLCGDQSLDEKQEDYYQKAADYLTEALIRQAKDTRRWLQLAEIQIQLDNAEAAERAYNEAIARNDENIPDWQINLTMAQWWLAQNYDLAEFYGELALNSAPADAAASVRQLMDQIAAGRAKLDE
jgi:tetratricopeptide (TPR) repeat protein